VRKERQKLYFLCSLFLLRVIFHLRRECLLPSHERDFLYFKTIYYEIVDNTEASITLFMYWFHSMKIVPFPFLFLIPAFEMYTSYTPIRWLGNEKLQWFLYRNFRIKQTIYCFLLFSFPSLICFFFLCFPFFLNCVLFCFVCFPFPTVLLSSLLFVHAHCQYFK
jgi:hypothetical protein